MEQMFKKNKTVLSELLVLNEKGSIKKKSSIIDGNCDFQKYSTYNLDAYKKDIVKYGLKKTWDIINYFVLNNEVQDKFLNINNFSKLYEIGLAVQDKQLKKIMGQYYTPDDVAMVLAGWFDKQKGTNICDVACGTGKLILNYLDLVGKQKAVDLIRGGKIYLYDIDDIALNICKTSLLLKYGKELEPFIKIIHCDFLSKKIRLPKNCKVISNPPYANVKILNDNWSKTEVAKNTKEYYSMFMEKIIKNSLSSVIISPYSFMSGNKFFSLRKIMNHYNGFIVSFDNVPGSIFCGKKCGIFNTNTTNSVRATITVVENCDNYKGFKTTPIIRFKNQERTKLLKNDILESFINGDYQIVTEKNPMFCKCYKQLNEVWKSWKNISKKCLGDYVSKKGEYILSVPNTCRYYTTASKGIMNRSGQIVLYINDKNVFNFIYCLINSSFAYWYWRLFDGGVNYTKKLLLSIPVFYDILCDDDKEFFNKIATEMINEANKYIIKKNNVGVQENVKFPRKYRDKINKKILDILGLNIDEKIFDLVHSNMALEINV